MASLESINGKLNPEDEERYIPILVERPVNLEELRAFAHDLGEHIFDPDAKLYCTRLMDQEIDPETVESAAADIDRFTDSAFNLEPDSAE